MVEGGGGERDCELKGDCEDWEGERCRCVRELRVKASFAGRSFIASVVENGLFLMFDRGVVRE